MNFILGLITGLTIFYLFFIYRSYKSRQKKRLRLNEYRRSPVLRKLIDTLRHIVFEYGVKRKNNDFTLNVSLNGKIRFQIMHRAHFPDLAKSESDIDFGLALYIPVNKLSTTQRNGLEKIFKEESEIYYYEEIPFDYHIVDFGKRVRFGGYLVTRILKEVFFVDESDKVDFELFTEGELPYIGLESNHPKKSL